jgi:membrane protein
VSEAGSGHPAVGDIGLGLLARLQRGTRLAWRASGQGVVEFYKSDNLTFASSIAYYTLLSLFPFLWLVATVFGKQLVSREGLVDVVRSALPQNLGFLMTQVEGMAEAPMGLSMAGTALTFWASMGVFGAVASAVNHAWGVEDRLGFFKHKLVAFLMLLAAGLLLVATLLLMSAINVVEATWFAGVVEAYPSLGALSGFAARNAPTPIIVLAIGLIYYFVPNAKVRLRDVWLGAVLAGVLWRLALFAYGWFMSDPQRLMQIHGSIAAVVLFLAWVYLSAVILLYGAEVTAAYARLRKHLPQAAPAADQRD